MQHLDYMFCTHLGQGDLFYEILTFVQITVNGVGGGYSMVPPLYETLSYKLVVLMLGYPNLNYQNPQLSKQAFYSQPSVLELSVMLFFFSCASLIKLS